ncbi:hypothetical protein [Streptomyces scabiei]|uniref:hypothetical protein n=1 Tax=Streptomyces scabiei TaxID=1930 RepID=UPI0029B1F3B7|nr:hypothetical protein [Streptomyces scabiei]MDX3523730.1 hypothetical protein [Streptomyces scabiei]
MTSTPPQDWAGDRFYTGARYTLAQFARRAGISESYARGMYSAGDKLPRPDGTDVDGKPWWRPDTIDRWCQGTGRAVPPDAGAIYHWPKASVPAPITTQKEVMVPRSKLTDRQVPVYVTVYETEHGHIVWVQRYTGREYELDHSNAARAAALVLRPRFWRDAVILVPDSQLFRDMGNYTPSVDAFRLDPPYSDTADLELPRWIPSFIKPRQVSEEAEPEVDPYTVPVVGHGLPDVDVIARVVGRELPLWFTGTCTPEGVRRFETMGHGATFTVPDTTTKWPTCRDRITAAYEQAMPTRFVHGWIALASDTVAVHRRVQRHHSEATAKGPGWYAPARPAAPDWPIAVETAARSAAAQQILPQAAAEQLQALRAEEAVQKWDSPYGDALWEALRVLCGHLLEHSPEDVFATVSHEHIEMVGPVVRDWRATLTPWPQEKMNAELARPSRRLMRLLSSETHLPTLKEFGVMDRAVGDVAQLYTDRAGRWVAEHKKKGAGNGVALSVEWPTGKPVGPWTEETIIAGDYPGTGVFALTPAPDGTLDIEPLPSSGGASEYTWGYGGTGPGDLYLALVSAALDTWEDRMPWKQFLGLHNGRGSALWASIKDADQGGSIRFAWSDIVKWAKTDHQSMTGN